MMIERILFKKIEMWVLILVVLLCMILALGFGIVVRQQAVGNVKFGMVGKTALFLAEIPVNIKKALNPEREAEILASEQRFDGRSSFVFYDETRHDEDQSHYLLASRYDHDLKRGLVELIDLTTGGVEHTWMPDIDAINAQVDQVDEFEFLERDKNQRRYRMIHPLLLSDGGLIFQDNSPLVRIDACSNLVFQNATDIFHHSVNMDYAGNIWVPTTIYPSTIEGFGEDFVDDAITLVSPGGEIIYQKSVTEILLDNDLQHEIYTYDKYIRDLIHLNDIQPVLADGPYWKKGDVFISLGHLNLVALFRPQTNELLWWTQQNLNHQHDIDILSDHEISIFDNNRIMSSSGDIVEGSNEIQVYDFDTDTMRSIFKASLEEYDVRTISQGLIDFAPNGNVFIEETDYGRWLELNPKGEVVWEFINRASDGNVYIVNWGRIIPADDIKIVKKSLATLNCEAVP